jgi:ABC-type multidrug transport system fused ATPase/permease subunit
MPSDSHTPVAPVPLGGATTPANKAVQPRATMQRITRTHDFAGGRRPNALRRPPRGRPWAIYILAMSGWGVAFVNHHVGLLVFPSISTFAYAYMFLAGAVSLVAYGLGYNHMRDSNTRHRRQSPYLERVYRAAVIVCAISLPLSIFDRVANAGTSLAMTIEDPSLLRTTSENATTALTTLTVPGIGLLPAVVGLTIFFALRHPRSRSPRMYVLVASLVGLYVVRNLLTGGRQMTMYVVFTAASALLLHLRGYVPRFARHVRRRLPLVLPILIVLLFFVYHYSAHRTNTYKTHNFFITNEFRYGDGFLSEHDARTAAGIAKLSYYWSHQLHRLNDFLVYWRGTGRLFDLNFCTFGWILEQYDQLIAPTFNFNYKYDIKAGGIHSYGWQTVLATAVLDFGFVGALVFTALCFAVFGRMVWQAFWTDSASAYMGCLYLSYAIWITFMGPLYRYAFWGTLLVFLFLRCTERHSVKPRRCPSPTVTSKEKATPW